MFEPSVADKYTAAITKNLGLGQGDCREETRRADKIHISA